MAKKEVENIQNTSGTIFEAMGMKPLTKSATPQASEAVQPEEPKPEKTKRTTRRKTQEKPKTSEKSAEQPEEEKKTETMKTAYSAWISRKMISEWDRYITISGITRSDLMKTAINDYINRHPLTAEQKRAYAEKMGLL